MAIKSPFVTDSPTSSSTNVDRDSPDELSVRSLLLGIVHRTAGEYTSARAFLTDAHKRHAEFTNSTWVGGLALFEMAVLELKEVDAATNTVPPTEAKTTWTVALKKAGAVLDQALALAMSNNTDLSSRLDSRIAMLRDEIAMKKEMIGIV